MIRFALLYIALPFISLSAFPGPFLSQSQLHAQHIAAQHISVQRIPAQPTQHQLLRPIIARTTQGDTHLLVANQGTDCGISVIELDTESATPGKFLANVPLGRSLTDLIRLPGSNIFLATDCQLDQTIAFRFTSTDGDPNLIPLWDVPVAGHPVKIVPQQNTTAAQCAVLGLWSRRVDVFQFVKHPRGSPNPVSKNNAETKPLRAGSFDLDFCPGNAVWISLNTLLVADAFGDRMAVLNTKTRTVTRVNDFAKQRTGGIAVDQESGSILISQQRLSSIARSTRNDVHWGMMVGNLVRRIPVGTVIKRLEADDKSLLDESRKSPVGRTGDAKTDLGMIHILGRDHWAVVVQGANEIAMVESDPSSAQTTSSSHVFIQVGRRPTSVTSDSENKILFVTNSLDNSISMIDMGGRKVVQTVSLGALPELTDAQRGERLFFDSSLSHDGWMSCHSCHSNGHTNGMLNDNLSDGTFGTPKRVISLLGHADNFPLAWNGSQPAYSDQISKTIALTMHGAELTNDQIADLTAYIRSLPGPPSVAGSRGELDAPMKKRIEQGQAIFKSQSCTDCHAGPSFTSSQVADIGVSDERGLIKLNPPSLIGLSQRNRLFHDNRIADLRQIFEQPGHQIMPKLDDEQMSALLAFLNSL